MGNNILRSIVANLVYTREYDCLHAPTATVEQWLMVDNISDTFTSSYPNAKKAQELKKTKLYKALK